MREGTAKTPSADAEGRIRLRDPGMGMYEEIAPTLDCGQPHGVAHAVAFTTRGRDDGLSVESQDELAYALKNPGAGGRSNDRMVAHVVAPPLTATNDPSRSPQSAEVTAQVEAVLRATYPEVAEIRRQSSTNHWDSVNGVHPTLCVGGNSHPGQSLQDVLRGAGLVPNGMSVRRLTPTECERLQGFPDGWTQISWKGKPASECPDGPRYRALGNSMAVPVIRWIGRKLNEELNKE